MRVPAGLGVVVDGGTWLEEGLLLGCAYPRREAAVAWLARQGMPVLINLHARAHDPAHRARHGLEEVHLPVPDFMPPSPRTVGRSVAAMTEALAAGPRRRPARGGPLCGGVRGRTEALFACYLIHQGLDPAMVIRTRAGGPPRIGPDAGAGRGGGGVRRRPVCGGVAGEG